KEQSRQGQRREPRQRVDRDRRRQEADDDAEGRAAQGAAHESHLSPSRSVVRVPAAARRAGAVDLRPERRRKPVPVIQPRDAGRSIGMSKKKAATRTVARGARKTASKPKPAARKKAAPIPAGYHTATPYLVCRG